MEHKTVSLEQMKESLAKAVGSRFPIKITRMDGEVLVRYVRGFADHDADIILISENSFSLALKIMEVKEILTLEYSPENAAGNWKILQAKWLKRAAKN